jgi:hypothetical protein
VGVDEECRVLPDPEVEPTVSVPRAGACLGLGRTASYHAAEAGQIPTLRIGKKLRVPTAALRRMVGLD